MDAAKHAPNPDCENARIACPATLPAKTGSGKSAPSETSVFRWRRGLEELPS